MTTPKIYYPSAHTPEEIAEFERIREAEIVAREVAMENELDAEFGEDYTLEA